jgi:hypothetical protein
MRKNWYTAHARPRKAQEKIKKSVDACEGK